MMGCGRRRGGQRNAPPGLLWKEGHPRWDGWRGAVVARRGSVHFVRRRGRELGSSRGLDADERDLGLVGPLVHSVHHDVDLVDVRVVVHKINVLQVPLSIVIKFLQNKPQ